MEVGGGIEAKQPVEQGVKKMGGDSMEIWPPICLKSLPAALVVLQHRAAALCCDNAYVVLREISSLATICKALDVRIVMQIMLNF